MNGLSIFAGNSNPILSDRIAEYLAKPLGRLKVNRFSDGETQVEIQENVRKQESIPYLATKHMSLPGVASTKGAPTVAKTLVTT